MLTCKEFLNELNEYLDDSATPDLRQQLEVHIKDCPNCFVIVDTTRQTLKVYKGMEPQSIPEDVKSRLLEALQRKMAAKR